MIQAYGLPVARQGNIIDLGFTKLQVVDACSGLHSLISLIVLCLLIVYFFKDHIWKRSVLLLSSIPLAIVTNSFRIAMTAILYKYFGAGVAEGFFHEFSGLLVFAICIPVLLIEMKLLEKLPPFQSKTTSESKKTDATTSENNPGSNNKKVSKYGVLLQPMFIVAVILLGATLAISHTVDFREKIPAKKNLEQFPLKIGEWSSSQRQRMAQKFIDVLDLSEYVIINYQNPMEKKSTFTWPITRAKEKGNLFTPRPPACRAVAGALINPEL